MNRAKDKKSTAMLLYATVSVVILLCGICLNTKNNERTWFACYAVLIIFMALLQFIVLKKYLSLVSISTIFLILTYLFHFGNVIAIGLFPNYKIQRNIYYLLKLSFPMFKSTVLFCVASVLMLGFGILFAAKPKPTRYLFKRSSKTDFLFGFILIIIGTPFIIEKLLTSLDIFFGGAYFDSFNSLGDGSGTKNFFCTVFYCGIACLVACYGRKMKAKAIIALLIAAAFLVANIILTGGRGLDFLMLLILIIVAFYNRIFIISKIKLIWLFIFAYIVMTSFNAIADVRDQGMQLFTNSFTKNISDNVILDIMQEMGGTVYTPYLCIVKMGNDYEVALGSTYINALVMILPNINGKFNGLIIDSHFANLLNVKWIGGSYIGETYFNFGYFGIVVVFLIGIIIYKIGVSFYNAVNKRNTICIAFLVPIVRSCLWWSRDAANGFARWIVWGGILLYIIGCLIGLGSHTLFNRKNICLNRKTYE